MPPIQVVAAVLHDGPLGAPSTRLLACRRAEGKYAAGRWEFPGGKVEPGETPQAALAREVLEELAVPIRVGELLDRTVTGRVDLACYAVALAGPAPTASTDHDALRWLTAPQLRELEWADADLPVVRLLSDG